MLSILQSKHVYSVFRRGAQDQHPGKENNGETSIGRLDLRAGTRNNWQEVSHGHMTARRMSETSFTIARVQKYTSSPFGEWE